DDVDDFKDDADNNDDDSDDNDESDDERMESDRDEIPNPNKTNEEYDDEEEEYDEEFDIEEDEKMDEEEDDEVTKELYKDVNVNLGNKDADMTDANQGGADQQNVSQQSGFEQEEEDAHMTLTLVLDTQNTGARHATIIPEITSSFTTTIPPPPPFFNPLSQQETPTSTPTASETTTLLPILPQAISDVATPVIEKNVTESLEATVLTRSSSQPQSSYEAAATLSEFELTKILINKMEKNKSFDIVDYKREPYDALVKSYNTDKDIFESYGEEAEPSRDSRSKENKSSSTSKDASKSQHKSFDESAHAEEPSHTIEDSGMQQDQEFVTRDNDEQPADKEVTKADWFKKPERPPTPDPDWSKRQHVDFRPPKTYISQVACADKPPTSFDKLNDTSFDFSVFVMNRLKILNLTQEILVGPAFNLLKGTCKSITQLEYHFEECSKATTKRLDWRNPENKPYPFDLRKPLPLIQDHRGRQIIPQDYFINNDLEYLKGGDLRRRYSTSVTKTKAATYDLK
ncbi:hypothetical protein Tco_0327800, partial [Tanacetum coccineum]